MEEIKRSVLTITDIIAVSEVQVYYKDDGLIAAKVDIVLPPKLTIAQAHLLAGLVCYCCIASVLVVVFSIKSDYVHGCSQNSEST